MKSHPKLILLLAVTGLASGRAQDNTSQIVYTSPNGAFRIEMTGVALSAGQGETTGDLWLVSTKNPTERAKLPKESDDSTLDDEFHFSPNAKWFVGLHHAGSRLRNGNLRPLQYG